MDARLTRRGGRRSAAALAAGMLFCLGAAPERPAETSAVGAIAIPLPPPLKIPPASRPAPDTVDSSSSVAALVDEASVMPAPVRKVKPAVVAAPPPPPALVRSPVAVLQVLDKVTAETLKFAAPIGRRVRYKTLLVEVKACETRGLADPQPKPSAYLIVTSQVGAPGVAAFGDQVFKGWMFANAPGVHALEHPIYDLWLVSCSAAAPTGSGSSLLP